MSRCAKSQIAIAAFGIVSTVAVSPRVAFASDRGNDLLDRLAAPFRLPPHRPDDLNGFRGERDPEDGFAIVPQARYWRPKLEGTLRVEDDSFPVEATRIDVDDDLDIEAADAVQGGLDLVLGNHRLGAQFVPLHFDGDTQLRETIVFHGTAYPVGAHVVTKLDLTLWTARYDYRLLHSSWGDLRLGPKAYLIQLDGRLRADALDIAVEEKRNVFTGAPAVETSGELRLGPVQTGVVASYGGFSGGGLDARVIDVEGSVGVRPLEWLRIEVGYRWLNVDLNDDDGDADLTLQGPTATLTVEITF